MHVISKRQTGGRKMLKTHIEQPKVGERNTKQKGKMMEFFKKWKEEDK